MIDAENHWFKWNKNNKTEKNFSAMLCKKKLNDGIINQSVLPLVARKQKGVVIIQDGGAWTRNKLTKSELITIVTTQTKVKI